MAKFTKSTEKKGAIAAAPAKIAAGVQKNKNKNKPAVAPAAKAAVAVAQAKAAVKPAKAADAVVAKPAKAAKVAGEKKQRPGHSVFVGNLPPKTKRDKLDHLFRAHATVSSVRFRKNNGSAILKTDAPASIIAFVDVATAQEAQAAAKALNGQTLGGNVLRVDVQSGGKNAAATDAKRTAFVGNLPYTTSENQLRKFFEHAGKIDYVRLNQSKKGCNGTAFVCYKEAASVVAALKLNGRDFNGRAMRVNRSAAKQQAQEAAKRPAEDAKVAAKAAEAAAEEEEQVEEDEDEDEDSEIDDDEDDSEEEEEEVVAPPPAKKSAAKAVPAKKKAAGKKGGKKN